MYIHIYIYTYICIYIYSYVYSIVIHTYISTCVYGKRTINNNDTFWYRSTSLNVKHPICPNTEYSLKKRQQIVESQLLAWPDVPKVSRIWWTPFVKQGAPESHDTRLAAQGRQLLHKARALLELRSPSEGSFKGDLGPYHIWQYFGLHTSRWSLRKGSQVFPIGPIRPSSPQ